jgi:hypothetical protein
MDGCTPYSILERVISQVVVDDIRAKARLAVEDEDALRETIRKRRQAAADAESCHNMKELREGEERLAQLETLISKTYEEKLLKLFLQTFACSLHSLNLKFAAITVL